MVKTSRKKKRQTKKGIQSDRTTQGFRLPPDATEFRTDRAVVVSQEALIRSGAPSCFELLMKRLEEPTGWDPMILEAKPMSDARRWAGTATRLTLKLGDRQLESPAIVTTYKRDSALTWVLTDHPKVKEYWRLEPKPWGTMVHFTLGLELESSGSIIKRLLQKIVLRRRLAQVGLEILIQLNKVAEATDF